MIEIRITNEIGSFEPKFIGPFTLRQFICLAIGLVFCYLIYGITFPYLPTDIAGFLCIIPAAIACLFGWCKPYGMHFEKFIKSTAVNIVFAPTHRRYRTQNSHEQMLHTLEEASEENEPPKKTRSVKEAKPKFKKRYTPGYYL